jgi:hypothetical protein
MEGDDSHWKWLKTLARSSRTTWLPSAENRDEGCVAVAWTVIAAKKPTTTMMIGTVMEF